MLLETAYYHVGRRNMQYEAVHQRACHGDYSSIGLVSYIAELGGVIMEISKKLLLFEINAP